MSSASSSTGKQPEDVQDIQADEAGGAVETGGSSRGIDGGKDAEPKERKWDDPPEKEPDFAPENPTTVILVSKNWFHTMPGREVEQIAFTGSDAHIVVRLPPANNDSIRANGEFPSVLIAYDVGNVARKYIRPAPSHGVRSTGDFALSAAPGTAAMAAWVRRPEPTVVDTGPVTVAVAAPRTYVFDLWSDKKLLKADFQVREPLALTPDASYLASVSLRDASRIVVLDIRKPSQPVMRQPLAVHSSPVTHLVVTPDGTGLVSASTDGSIRMTGLQSGRTLRKAEVERGMHGAASMLRISPDGDLVVSLWGRRVYLWRLKTDVLAYYDLDAVRQIEGWPLNISPDCRYMVCRTEDGVDLHDVETGSFLADYPLPAGHHLVTSAAFSHNARWLTIGDYHGRVTVLEVITAAS